MVTSELPEIPRSFPIEVELGRYSGDLDLDKKFDFTYNSGTNSYLRGKWITIVSSSTTARLTLSEIRDGFTKKNPEKV